jgi:hypothetical protein
MTIKLIHLYYYQIIQKIITRRAHVESYLLISAVCPYIFRSDAVTTGNYVIKHYVNNVLNNVLTTNSYCKQ